MSTLDGLAGPGQLRELPESDLPGLAAEIRQRLIDSVSRTGGHLGPNLGVVELTIALHRVFCSPRDAIVWDTGHQAYVHKMLTGRHDGLPGLRQPGGLSGYPSRTESAHDLVENSHASTSLSYVDGLAKAFALSGSADRVAVAVVGDGSLTGGMCWEALNNIASAPDRPVIIVLNDNGRSYAPTVGAVGSHLAALRGGLDRSLFEQLGLAYLGPVDGHDTAALEAALRKARALGTAVVVHCVTRKGYGYPAAEADEADQMHTISPAKPAGAPVRPTWTDVLGDELVAIGARRPDVVAVTAAMLIPTGLKPFADRFPDRVYDVGIAEQHAVTSAAGLAMGGRHPVVCVYATFLNRAFDQVLMDVALHRLGVTFVLDRAGITGSDGPSHNGMWDLSLLGMVPGMRIAAPRDGQRLGELLREAVDHADGPTALRFPKAEVAIELPATGRLGNADLLRSHADPDVLIVAVGPMAGAALAAADELAAHGVFAAVADPRWIMPVDPGLVRAAGGYRLVVTVEDNGEHGGFGDAFARAARGAGIDVKLRTLALNQRFLAQGERKAMLAAQGLDGPGIARTVLAGLDSPKTTRPLREAPALTTGLGRGAASDAPSRTGRTIPPLTVTP
ncbi:1-deoxy-D-xylulose-5-phosphate synthase [Rugosimonospora africana]|uniref:1-deoxy-D-xylulose-5-phosphate synthase n=1 Tax=Rugosimonospora africana TaxID=556532 RepID=A0A8J3QQE5_9ACTN|nr:1-deoxy-D-xylulose-5-phosphate synthase [Rugosimonospora africana]GIH14611.1 1-deoxy-D-xylulose-5-phosphate synthase [Rugosimonospora africana]